MGRSGRIDLRVTDGERKAWLEASGGVGLGLSEWIRQELNRVSGFMEASVVQVEAVQVSSKRVPCPGCARNLRIGRPVDPECVECWGTEVRF